MRPKGRGLASRIDGLLDLLAEAVGGDIVLTKMKVFQGNDDYAYCKIHFSSFVALAFRRYGSFLVLFKAAFKPFFED